MKRFLNTNGNDWHLLLARLAVAIVIWPHGAQKLLGLFGGIGFSKAMEVIPGSVGVPAFMIALAIIVEFFGTILLFFGFLTRFASLALIGNFIGVYILNIAGNGFFMNWRGVEGQGEGIEFFILLFALMIISLLGGGGKYSLDSIVSKKVK